MKLLKDLIYKAGIEEVVGSTNVAIEQICFDSRKVEEMSLFTAIRGTTQDGHEHISKAIEAGASAILCEEMPEQFYQKVTYVKVKDSRQALAQIACNFYDNPSKDISLVGVTGTNGKTTVSSLCFQLFKSLGYKVGLLSTVRNLIHNEVIDATHTTPDPVMINALLREMVDYGCSHCFMEVSSHALDQKRSHGLDFDVAIFTNITHDHLDYHKTFDNYIAAKKILFDNLAEDAYALVNLDDFHSEVMVQNTKAKVKSYGIKTASDFKAKILENQFSGMQLNIDGQEVWTKLIGNFNASNLLAVYACGILLEEDKLELLTSISNLKTVDGRFEYVKTENNITGIVDYAHTPDALKNVLKTIGSIRSGKEKLITVVGCGGDRDKSKRPEMASIAAELSNQVILTSDNPRSEDPNSIIEDMKKGLDPIGKKKSLAISDRREAIRTACSMANQDDIILVAGKGHEKYQEINGERKHFDDLEELNNALKPIKD